MSASVVTIEGKGSSFRRQISNSVVQSGVHSKQLVIQSTPSQTIPVTATLIIVNEASDWNSLMEHLEWRAWLNVSGQGNEMSQSLSIKKHHCFEEYRLSRNLVLVRRIYTLLGKVAGA